MGHKVNGTQSLSSTRYSDGSGERCCLMFDLFLVQFSKNVFPLPGEGFQEQT